MRQNQYDQIALKAAAYIRTNASRLISVADIIKCTGYSRIHVERAFRKILNQSIAGALQAERLRLAKKLLAETNLGVAAIAFESGFGDYANFARVFHAKTGLSPSGFRKKAFLLKELPESRKEDKEAEAKPEKWLEGLFLDNVLGENWKPISGQWKNEQGILTGTGENVLIGFLKPLPENCRITLEVLPSAFSDLRFPDVALGLLDESRSKYYCSFAVATGDRTTGYFRRFRFGYTANLKAHVGFNEWHSLSLEIREDTLVFYVDGKQAYLVRDPFPPAYATRCYLNIGTWRCNLQIRKLAIQNLGFMPAINPIRQGDSLYNAGLIENAREFYTRYLESGSASDAETMELRFKIGICCLQQKAFTPAQMWIDKVVALQGDRFWSTQARLALIELCWKTSNLQALQDHIRLCVADPETRDSARVITQLAVEDFGSRGMFDEAALVAGTWAHVETPDPYTNQMALMLWSEYLLKLRRFADAGEILHAVKASRFPELALSSHINLMHLHYEWGKFTESEDNRAFIEKEWPDSHTLARCRIQLAMSLRGQEKLEEALQKLREILTLFPYESELSAHALVQSAPLLCCLGRLSEGRKVLDDVNALSPGSVNARHYLPFFMREENYAAAAEELLSDYRQSKELVSSSAETGIKAGIVHELAARRQEAKAIFKEVSLRFPNEQVRFFGPMAAALFTGANFDFAEMPYEAHRRSEMFYLLGLLKEKRGKSGEAKPLFELCIKEDPALRWPAYFAKQKMKSSRIR